MRAGVFNMNKYPWIRLYREALNDPKIVTLSDRHHRAWINCLLIADDETGALPSMRDIAVHLRTSASEAEQLVRELVELELVDFCYGTPINGYIMHGWANRQQPSDSSAERTRRYRERLKAKSSQQRHGDVTVTVQTQTQKEKFNNKPSTVDRAREGVFESEILVSVDALRKAAALCRVGDPDPILRAYRAWPKRGVIHDVDAHFVRSAKTIYGNLSAEDRAACQPLDAPEPIAVKPVAASKELQAKLRGKRRG